MKEAAICGECEKSVKVGKKFLQILGMKKIGEVWTKIVVCVDCEKMKVK